jgi:hypothetical protein
LKVPEGKSAVSPSQVAAHEIVKILHSLKGKS